MLRGPSTVRLTRREAARWTTITGFEPVGVRTVADLLNYVDRCREHFWGTSDDTKFLHFLMKEELERNVASAGHRTQECR